MSTVHPLLPDLDATIEVDPVECALEGTTGAESKLAEYKASPEQDRCFRFVVGYITPSKMAGIRYALARMMRGLKTGEQTKELNADEVAENTMQFMERIAPIHREALKYGLRGWTIKEPFPVEKVTSGGREYVVASEALLDQIEMRGWSFSLAGAVLDYNTLSDEKKSAL